MEEPQKNERVQLKFMSVAHKVENFKRNTGWDNPNACLKMIYEAIASGKMQINISLEPKKVDLKKVA